MATGNVALHYPSLQVTFERDVFKTIASFIASRKAMELPTVEVAKIITSLVYNANISWSKKHFQTEWSLEENE